MNGKIFISGAVIVALGAILLTYTWSDLEMLMTMKPSSYSSYYWAGWETQFKQTEILRSIGIGLIVLGGLITVYGGIKK